MSAAENKAIFLSYASQDAEAARRICDALRASGVEVWFDQSELVGGDAWDQKIRRQIKECALFVPVISAATQARTEGYFRLEWRLADQRTHLMAKGRPFLMPVVIDETRDAEAHVPDSFLDVQWTRLPDGEKPEKFCARVKALLGSSAMGPERPRPVERGEGAMAPTRAMSHRPWLVPATLALAAAIAVAIWQPWKKPAPVAPTNPTPTEATPTAPLSEARRLVAQARRLFDSGDYVDREDVFLAEDLLKKAQALDSTDAEVWAALGQLSRDMIVLGYERTSSRYDLMRQQSERAYKLAPSSIEAQIAYAGYLQWAGKESALEATRMLEALLARSPGNRQAYRVLGMAWSFAGDIDKAMEACRRSNALPGGDPVALMMGAAQLQWWGRYAEIDSTIEQADAVSVTVRSRVLHVLLDLCWRGDLDGAAAALDKWPVWMQREDRGAFVASQVWMWRHEPDKAIAVLNPIARDAFYDTYYTGPKAVLLALAHEMAGRPQAARAEWENALRVATRMVAEQPSLKRALALKAVAMAKLGESAEAEALLRSLEQGGDLRGESWSCAHPSALLRLALGHADEVPASLTTERMAEVVSTAFAVPRAGLELNPVYDPVRMLPAFQRLIASAPAPAKKNENTSSASAALDGKSVAVLPFANLSGDPGQEYFSDGLTEEILTALSNERDLRVPGRTSAFAFKGKTITAPEIARALNVAQVVEGSVRKAGNQVKISVTLTRASDGFSEPLGTFTEKLDDIFALQEKVARAVVEKITQRNATAGGVAVLTENPAAYDIYLRARALETSQNGAMKFLDVFGLYEQATKLDPDFALAWARLSQICEWMFSQAGDRDGLANTKAQEGAITALRLAPNLPEAHLAMSMVHLAFDRDPAAARRELDEAVRLRPNDPETVWIRARLDYAVGPWNDDLVRLLLRAAELDPQNATELLAIGVLLRSMGRFADADRLFTQSGAVTPRGTAADYRALNHLIWTGDVDGTRKVLTEVPEALRTSAYYAVTGMCLATEGDLTGAIASYEKMRARVAGHTDGFWNLLGVYANAAYQLGRLHARLGHPQRAAEYYDEALGVAREVTQRYPRSAIGAEYAARIHASRGEKAEALTAIAETERIIDATGRYTGTSCDAQLAKAEALALLGETGAAVDTLRAVHATGYAFGYLLRREPTWEPLRGDAKFQQLVKEAEARADAQPRPKI